CYTHDGLLYRYALCYGLSSVFFFSSRRRHTRFSRDWSSDVCSSDLLPLHERVVRTEPRKQLRDRVAVADDHAVDPTHLARLRSEIGRASCRERVETTVVAVASTKHHTRNDRVSISLVIPTSSLQCPI